MGTVEQEHETQKTVVVCFDSVIGSARVEDGQVVCTQEEPTEGIQEALQDLIAEYRIVIYSRFCMYPGGQEAIETYLRFWSLPYDAVLGERPPRTRFIDRWAIPFSGRADLLPDLVRHFQANAQSAPPVAGMRRCTGKQVGLATHETAEGWFHCWMETSTVQGTCVVALMEGDDGRMVQCPAWTVQFLDR